MLPPALFVAIVVCLLLFRKYQKYPNVPPGPPAVPILGHLFALPSTHQWKTFANWSRDYKSDILHLSVAGKSIIVLNSLQATNDLMEQRSRIYSERPRLPMINELMGWNQQSLAMGLMPYGNKWLARRKIVQQAFSKQSLMSYGSQLEKCTESLINDLFVQPSEFMAHFKRMSTTFIMSTVYGIEVKAGSGDPFIGANEAAVDGLKAAGIAGRFLVDTLPILKYVPEWFPGADFKRLAREWKENMVLAFRAPFEEAWSQFSNHTLQPCLVLNSLDELGVDNADDSDERINTVRDAAGSIYTAAVDTAVSSLATFLLAMLANPEAQKLAQIELDRLERLPLLQDDASLPYISALVKEVLRWKNVAPLAIPHCVAEEDEYRGYKIPKGATIIGNIWAICHDDAIYPDPDKFSPERFLGNNPRPDPDVAFGFGRRTCPGQHLATSMLFLCIARILAVFEISKGTKLDEFGREVDDEPSYEYSSGLAAMPLPFKCTFKPRALANEMI
ncbi:Cytochrome P450 [Mycena indigotica]|uniref:Cytochrome P450 n=1 Tax=Mycena indigotica TaxID=2126181 RepID=A0A8H6VZ38_9AGAR|nr:Cytochrome P450 [Mycena indigotica]KAF7297151.1 Cytochrome P450 [Mycena indigotica]